MFYVYTKFENTQHSRSPTHTWEEARCPGAAGRMPAEELTANRAAVPGWGPILATQGLFDPVQGCHLPDPSFSVN